jgi:GNAT superfamily N-acetyltransferase
VLIESAKEKQVGEYTLYAHARPHKNEWTIEALWGTPPRTVGTAEFAGVKVYPDPDEPDAPSYSWKLVALKGWSVEVDPKHRRKGLASAMYAFAEEAFGLPIRSGDFQTPTGEKFLKGKKH